MTASEIKNTIRQMLADWDAATDQQRADALAAAADAATEALEETMTDPTDLATCGECRYCAPRPNERETLACWSEFSTQNNVNIDIDAEDEACPEFEEREDAEDG